MDFNRVLRDNLWVQSPLWPEVGALLGKLSPAESYFPRGSGQATIELDELIAKHRQWVSRAVDLSRFPHAYLTAGATEGINQWRLTDPRPWQFLTGDYQWPQMVSGNGSETSVHGLEAGRVLYVTNPSARDGNFLTSGEAEQIEKTGCPVILDCAYLGATQLRKIHIFENTEQILFSFSKGWGLVGQRVGLLYSRRPHPALKHMRKVECWNYQTTSLVEALLDRFAIDSMHEKAYSTQLELCSRFDVVPSDTYFLATSNNPYFKKQMRIEGTARLCLTPFWPVDSVAPKNDARLGM